MDDLTGDDWYDHSTNPFWDILCLNTDYGRSASISISFVDFKQWLPQQKTEYLVKLLLISNNVVFNRDIREELQRRG